MNVLELFPLHPRREGRDEPCADDFLEHPIIFVERFWRWRDSLFVVACRILRDQKAASEAVEASFRVACPKPPKFESDGEFGSWLLRILIDEAASIRQSQHRQKRAPQVASHQAVTSQDPRVACFRTVDDFWCLEITL